MGTRREMLRVDESRPQERLDIYLQHRFPAVSRGTIQRLIDGGHVWVNGRGVKRTHHPRAGEEIEVEWPEAKPLELVAEKIPLEVLFEDADVLVVNKPAGMVVHPGAGHDEHTLVHALLHHCKGSLSGIGGVARPGIVHRLDKDTSGCLVVAKNDVAHLALAEQFATRELCKTYHLLVCGNLPSGRGEIRAPIGRHPSHRKRMAVREGEGRDAWTSYRVLRRLAGVTFVEASLHTGRTHQIRVHFHHLGFPLLGDQVYGLRQNRRFEEETGIQVPRQMLHAFELRFRHPRKEEELVICAGRPKDFEEILRALKGVEE